MGYSVGAVADTSLHQHLHWARSATKLIWESNIIIVVMQTSQKTIELKLQVSVKTIKHD